MKIEKVNDNQIKCTLTREDLENRQINLSELAYGTEKAKLLFRDMMQQAFSEFGFEAENIPLMIEAIPVSKDTVILIITKVEDPEELDTRFSRFAPQLKEELEELITSDPSGSERADEILDLFRQMTAGRSSGKSASEPKHRQPEPKQNVPLTRLYAFESLDHVIDASHVLSQFFTGSSRLYKSPSEQKYFLELSHGKDAPELFNKACNILTEYGTAVRQPILSSEYLDEHFNVMIASDAIAKLSNV